MARGNKAVVIDRVYNRKVKSKKVGTLGRSGGLLARAAQKEDEEKKK